MENTMMLPASCCVMNEEEMTYTSGGATMGQAVLACIVWPYAWMVGLSVMREYRKSNPNTWTETGLDALVTDMSKSVPNFIYDFACATTIALTSITGVGLLINAAVVML